MFKYRFQQCVCLVMRKESVLMCAKRVAYYVCDLSDRLCIIFRFACSQMVLPQNMATILALAAMQERPGAKTPASNTASTSSTPTNTADSNPPSSGEFQTSVIVVWSLLQLCMRTSHTETRKTSIPYSETSCFVC